MNQLFEFGEFWDVGTFILFLILGFTISFFSWQGAKASITKDNDTIRILDILSNKNVRINGNFYYLVIFLLLFVIYTFRSEEVGADTPGYVELFRNTTSLKFEMNSIFPTINLYEPFFIIYTYLIRTFTDNYTVFFSFIGLLIAYSYTKFIKVFWTRGSSNIFLVSIVCNFFYDMNVMRSAIGTAFILLSICAMEQRKTAKACILTMVASMFHFTSIVNMPLIILMHIVENGHYLRKKKLFFWIFAGVIFLVLLIPISRMVLSGSKYQSYLGNVNTVNILGLWNIILSVLLSVVILFAVNNKNRYTNILAIVGLYNIIVILLIMKVGMYRVGTYYGAARLSLWDKILMKMKRNNRFFLRMGFYIITGVLILFKMSRYSSSPGFEYKTVFNLLK